MSVKGEINFSIEKITFLPKEFKVLRVQDPNKVYFTSSFL